MKTHFIKYWSVLLFVACSCQIIWATPHPQTSDICDSLTEGKFLRQVTQSASVKAISLFPESIDRNSGKFNSELVATFKPISNASAANLAKGLRDCIMSSILSPNFSGAAAVRNESDTISSVSVYGVDKGMRVRIEADAVTLGDGSVRLKLICVTSEEAQKESNK